VRAGGRCAVHKLRNLERKAPKHALDELREDFHCLLHLPEGAVENAAHQIKLRKIDGHATIATVISQRLRPAA
jgi:hypothetical protein